MAKILVPVCFAKDYSADDRFHDRDAVECPGLAPGLRSLAEGRADELYLSARSGSVSAATLSAVSQVFTDCSRPTVLLSSLGHVIWANDLAHNSHLSPDDLDDNSLASLFDEHCRISFLTSLDKSASKRTVVRQIVYRSRVAHEIQLVPTGTNARPLMAAIIGPEDLAGALSGRMERLAAMAPHLFPEDAEALVRLPHAERIDLIKDLIEKTVREGFEFDDFILRTLDEKTGALEAVIARSGSGDTLHKRVLHAETSGESVAGFVAATGRPYLVEDASNDPLWISDLVEAQSAVVVPLKIGEKVMGTFAIEKKEKFAYDRYDLILASLFAGYVTAVLNEANLVGLGQRVLVDRVAERVVEEAAGPFQSILDSVDQLRKYNIGDSIAVASRLESISASVAAIRDAISKGAKKVGAEVTPPPPPADSILGGKLVLIADDEPSILSSLGDILKGSGCIVDFAHDGLEAVEMAARKTYDLLLSDIKMPKMSGYEVYASVKSKSPSTGVILMTAYGYDPTHSIVRARQEGLEAVLYKPFRAETLKKTLRQALEKKVAKT